MTGPSQSSRQNFLFWLSKWKPAPTFRASFFTSSQLHIFTGHQNPHTATLAFPQFVGDGRPPEGLSRPANTGTRSPVGNWKKIFVWAWFVHLGSDLGSDFLVKGCAGAGERGRGRTASGFELRVAEHRRGCWVWGLHWPVDLWACGLVGGAYRQGEVEDAGEGFRLGKADQQGRCCRIPARGKFLQFCKL